MSTMKITDYTQIIDLGGNEFLLISQDGIYKKVTLDQIRNLATDITNTELADLVGKAASATDVKNILSTINTQLSEKANQIDLESHASTLVTSTNGIHGFKIETGTWTPTLIGISGGEATYSIQTGSYKRQGDLVLIQFTLVIATKGTILTGGIEIGGLPFVILGIAGSDIPSPTIGEINGIIFPSNCTNVIAVPNRSTNLIPIRFNKNDGNSSVPVQDVNITQTFAIRGSMIYKIV